MRLYPPTHRLVQWIRDCWMRLLRTLSSHRYLWLALLTMLLCITGLPTIASTGHPPQSPLAKEGSPVLPLTKGELEGVPVLPLTKGELEGVPVLPLTKGELEGVPVLPLTKGELEGVDPQILKDARDLTPTKQQAQQLYETGQYQAAIAALQETLTRSQTQNDWQGEAIALTNLSLVHQHLSQWDEAEQTIGDAIALLTTPSLPHSPTQSILAQALDIRAQLQRSQGQLEQAVESWDQAIALYQNGGASDRAALSQIAQAQTLQSLGFYPVAIDHLTQLSKTLDNADPNLTTINTWQHLGDAQRGIGRLYDAEQSFRKSLQLTQALKSSGRTSYDPDSRLIEEAGDLTADDPNLATAISSAYLGLGNVARSAVDIQSFSAEIPSPSAIDALLSKLNTALNTNSVSSNSEDDADRIDNPRYWLENAVEAIAWYQAAATVPHAPPAATINAQLNTLSLLSRTREQLHDMENILAVRQQSDYRQPAPDPVSYDELKATIQTVNRQISTQAQALQTQIQPQLAALAPGRAAIEAQVNLAQSFILLSETDETIKLDWTPTVQALNASYQHALKLGDRRSQSFVLGTLGHIYELNHQTAEAQSLSQDALIAAIASRSLDSQYQWQWQIGRLLNQQGQHREAIDAYTRAFETLQALRTDLAAVNADIKFSFRKSVEPVYRQLVDLLLDPTVINPDTGKKGEISQADLKQAREVMEALQVAELENFFQSACLEPELQLDTVIKAQHQKAAVIYSIILDNRIEVILKRPNDETLIHYPPQMRSNLDTQAFLQTYRRDLQAPFTYAQVKQEGKTLYNWLIQPGKARLDEQEVNTLIFVLDGALRMVPMGALYDGQQYLAETYAIDVVLGLEISDPKPLAHKGMRILAAGLKDPPEELRDRYATLTEVPQELAAIVASEVPSTILQEEEFTKENFNRVLNQSSYDVLHLATHGQFSANRENTFLLDAEGDIPLDELSALFGTNTIQASAVELLILSACRTATGSDRDVLGIAGTTVRAGAQSAIASLWSLDDESSVEFTKTFYQEISKPDVSRAQALKKAQQAVMSDPRFDHPRYWAPYILVGNWL